MIISPSRHSHRWAFHTEKILQATPQIHHRSCALHGGGIQLFGAIYEGYTGLPTHHWAISACVLILPFR